jgi:predicted transcriptional regulator
METKKVIELAGSSAELARLLEITPGAISQWGKEIPAQRVWQLKVIKPQWFESPRPQKTVQKVGG